MYKSDYSRTALLLTALFLIAISLSIWTIEIYRATIVDQKYVVIAGLFGTLITFLILLQTRFKIVWILFHSIVIGTGFLTFGLLHINQSFAEKARVSNEFDIVETGNLTKRRKSNCKQPFAIIDFYGERKELLFYCQYEKAIKAYSKVKLTYSKGLFGFEVITAKELIN